MIDFIALAKFGIAVGLGLPLIITIYYSFKEMLLEIINRIKRLGK